ncbi:odorant receptor Or2-like [Sitophilus oryzae]|uniref:Odorant receptor Or2-like n=1 Tax=Sitophilus oryzae TaxID=7048 RepID=A0A6J2XI90_SITOR|nr:odorant receptor Or2-like [Sitophilus oryzae]
MSEVVFFVVYGSGLTFQIFVLAYSTNEVKDQSLAIYSALWNSLWYNTDQSTKKSIIIMMAASQRPLLLTIGPFGPMTLDSAIAVMKAAYSYATLMANTMGSN